MGLGLLVKLSFSFFRNHFTVSPGNVCGQQELSNEVISGRLAVEFLS